MSAVWALAAFFMTLAGGAFAFRYQRYLLFIMAFSAGILIGVVFLHLMPEVMEMSAAAGLEVRTLMIALIAGFVIIFLLEKLTVIHSEKQHGEPGHHHNVGLIGALGLTFHAFLDGLAIGIGFQAGKEVGLIVLVAVLAHDFADGLNTVTFMLATRNSRWRTGLLLLVHASAPVLGALVASVVDLEPRVLAYQLAFSSGFLLYLGASDLLPHVHESPKAGLITSTLVGIVCSGLMVFLLEQSH